MSRPRIAFFDSADVFEDFYPHYGVDQQAFVSTWAASGNHAFVALLQEKVGDVTWYQLSLAPKIGQAVHERLGFRVSFLRSAWMHRCLWKTFYLPRQAWRWRGAYRQFATLASYVALGSPAVIRALARDKPDVLFVQDYFSGRFDMLLAAARWLGVPIVARHTGSSPDKYLGRAVRRWTLPAANMVVASSHDELAMLTSEFRLAPERARVVLTPIDVRVFHAVDRATACAALGLDAARRYVLFVGRFDRVKRIDAIVRAFSAAIARHPDVDLVLAGDGWERRRTQALADKLSPGRVRYVGWVSDPTEKARLYSAAECLVLASSREGFPAVVGEAMACGTPVLSSRVGGVPELVREGETGWMFEPGDDEALLAKLSWILDHPDGVRAMRPRAERRALELVSPEVVSSRLRECLAAAGVRTFQTPSPTAVHA